MTRPGQPDGQRLTGQAMIRDRYPVVRPGDGAASTPCERRIARPELTIEVMRLSGSSSWRFEHDNGYMLRMPLFVRDTSLLPVADSDEIPPPLVGEVPDASALLSEPDRAVAARQWASWWRHLVDQAVREVIIRRAEDPREDMQIRMEARFHGREEVCDPPSFRSLAAAPELQSAAMGTLGAYRAWSADAARRPGPDRELFAWQIVRDAAHDAAASLGLPVSETDAVAHVIAVQGRWSYVAGAGCGICSTDTAADRATASELLRQLFVSGAPAGT